MTYPKIQPCPKCQNDDVALYGYGDWGTTWHVECDDCHYLGRGGNKLQAIRAHNALAAAAREGGDVKQAPGETPQSGQNGNAQ